jgi:hypothetical protein
MFMGLDELAPNLTQPTKNRLVWISYSSIIHRETGSRPNVTKNIVYQVTPPPLSTTNGD